MGNGRGGEGGTVLPSPDRPKEGERGIPPPPSCTQIPRGASLSPAKEKEKKGGGKKRMVRVLPPPSPRVRPELESPRMGFTAREGLRVLTSSWAKAIHLLLPGEKDFFLPLSALPFSLPAEVFPPLFFFRVSLWAGRSLGHKRDGKRKEKKVRNQHKDAGPEKKGVGVSLSLSFFFSPSTEGPPSPFCSSCLCPPTLLSPIL